MIQLFDPTKQFETRSGTLNTAGRLRVYINGTDDPALVYDDAAGHTVKSQPMILDDNGRAGNMYVDGNSLYRLEVYDRYGALLWTVTGMSGAGGGGGGMLNDVIVKSSDGTVSVHSSHEAGTDIFDLSTVTEEPSVIKCNSEALDGSGPFVIHDDSVDLQGEAIRYDDTNHRIVLDEGWYHVDVNVIVQNQLDRNDLAGIVITDNIGYFNGQYNIDLSVTGQQSLPVSYDIKVAADNTRYDIVQGASTQNIRYYLTNLNIHRILPSLGEDGGGLSGNTIEFVTASDNSATVRDIIARGNLPVLKDDYQGTDIQYEPLCRDLPGENKFYFGRTEYEGGDTIYFCGHVLDGATDTWSGYSRFLATTDDLSGKIDKVTGASGGEVALVNPDGSLTTGPHVSSLAYTGMLMAYQPLSGMSAYAYESSNSAKLDASASANFYPMTGNPSGFLTGVDLTPYQPVSAMSGYATTGDLGNKQDASAMSAYVPYSSFGYNSDSQISGINGSAIAGAGVTGTYVEQSAFNDYSAGVDSALGDKLDVTAYDSAKYPSVCWPYGLAQTTGQLLLQESRYPKYVQALVSGTGETASAGIIPPIPSSNLTSVRVLAAASGSLPDVSWIDYEPGYPTSNPSGFITSQVVTSTATQLYAGTAYLTSVNGTPISASRAGNADNATLAISAQYDSKGRAVSSLASTGDLADYIPTSVSSQFLTSETVSATAGTAGYVTSINGSAISGVGGGGGGGDYDGVAPIHVDNVGRKISVDYSALAVDETMTSYTSGGSAVIGVSTAGLVSDGFLTSVDLTPYQTTAGMSAYIPTSVSSQFLTSETVTATAGADGYITSINGSGLSGAGGGVTGDYVEKSSISAESANWNDTYSAVSSNSASWDAPAFPLEISTGTTVKAVVTTGFQDNTSTRPTLFISSNPLQTAYPRMLLSENRTGAVTNKSSTYLSDAFEFYSAANNTAAGTKIFRADPTTISGSQLTAAVGKGWRIGSAEYDLWNGASAMSSKQDVSGMSAYVKKSAVTVAIGSAEALNTSLAQGKNVTASYLSFAQGSGVSAYDYSLAQGKSSTSYTCSLAQGSNTFASAESIAQGLYASATGTSLAQGTDATASARSLAQGYSSKSYDTSLAQGSNVSASAKSLAQGYSVSADRTSLAQGDHATAGSKSLAQGYSAWATDESFAQGDLVTATVGSFAQGSGVQASNWAFAHGRGVTASASATVFGTFNLKGNGSADNVAFTIGNGTAASDRHDLLNVFRNGEITVYSATSDTTGFPIVSNVKGVYGAVSANSATWASASAISSYALSADVSSTIDTVSTHSANWGLALSAGPGIKLEKVGDTLVASTDETVLWSGSSVMSANVTLPLNDDVTKYRYIDIYSLPHYTNHIPEIMRISTEYMAGNTDAKGSYTVIGHAGGGGMRFNNAYMRIIDYTSMQLSERQQVSFIGSVISTASPQNTIVKVVGVCKTAVA